MRENYDFYCYGLQEGTIDVSEFEHPFYIPSV